MDHATDNVSIGGLDLPAHSTNTIVIGSGAAGLGAALQLHRRGVRDVLIVTERWGAGASNEAGSDKQTYYKLSLAGGRDDSPRRMAADLSAGGCMHGDIALCEAQHSAEAFFNLVGLGVPFPHDRFGGYAGYQTDNDQHGRATSAGPLTSHLMCECLGRAVRAAGVPVLDQHQVVALLTRDEDAGRAVCGAIAIDHSHAESPAHGLVLLNAVNVVLATGGPGGLYAESVYPESQIGSIGLALAIGAIAQNLTESQFGLASLDFRWNLSGSYQQALPRYVSTDANGGDEREFLSAHFPDLRTLTTAIFRKGYQWPFDCDKLRGFGSSFIDLLVHREIVRRGRRVLLDFTRNPSHPPRSEEFSIDDLDDEPRAYLTSCGALRATPIERLAAMNRPAIELYRAHGIDLARRPLRIAVCAQHNNGGLRGDIWWESNIKHLFPIGEVNGTHGVRRPGGAALNAGQVGALRAAMFIARRYATRPPATEDFAAQVAGQLNNCLGLVTRLTAADERTGLRPSDVTREVRERMSSCAAMARQPGRVSDALRAAWTLHERAASELRVTRTEGLAAALRALDLCFTHAVYLAAIDEYLRAGGGSRGSFLVLDPTGVSPGGGVCDYWLYRPADPDAAASRRILEVSWSPQAGVTKNWVDPRPIPDEPDWFEQVWADYRADHVIR